MISDPWIDRSWTAPPRRVQKPRIPRVFRTDEESRAYTKARRAELRAAGRCINGPAVGNVGHSGLVHGEVFKIGRCLHCYLVKTRADG